MPSRQLIFEDIDRLMGFEPVTRRFQESRKSSSYDPTKAEDKPKPELAVPISDGYCRKKLGQTLDVLNGVRGNFHPNAVHFDLCSCCDGSDYGGCGAYEKASPEEVAQLIQLQESDGPMMPAGIKVRHMGLPIGLPRIYRPSNKKPR
jgi:hypothetical protein